MIRLMRFERKPGFLYWVRQRDNALLARITIVELERAIKERTNNGTTQIHTE